MRLRHAICALVLSAASVSFLSGCATSVARTIGSITADKNAEARSGSVWVIPPPELEPLAANKKVAYVSYRNISDADVDILELLRESAREQGWRLTTDPDEATYRLRVSTRFFGEVAPESGGTAAAQSLGGIMGAAVGVTAGYATARATDSGLAGLGVGAATGGLVAAGLSNASRPREWALILDVLLEEKMEKEIEFQIATTSGTSGSHTAGTTGPRSNATGGTRTGTSSDATATRTSQFFPHGVRLSVWASQMNMQEEEAMPHITQRLKKVVTQMLPM